MPASTVYVKPGQHDVVLIPERNMAKLPPEGALVELTPYWRGRLRRRPKPRKSNLRNPKFRRLRS